MKNKLYLKLLIVTITTLGTLHFNYTKSNALVSLQETTHASTTTVAQISQDSGFVDENNKALSIEELEAERKKATGWQWGNIIHDLIILAIVVAGLIIIIRKRRKRTSFSSMPVGNISVNQTQALPNQPVGQQTDPVPADVTQHPTSTPVVPQNNPPQPPQGQSNGS